MPWIDMINENEAEGELADIYSQITEPWGGVDNIMKIHSLNIDSLKYSLKELYQTDTIFEKLYNFHVYYELNLYLV